MIIANAKEKIILTEKEADILISAYDILTDIHDESGTVAGSHAEIAIDAISDLIYEGEQDNSEYTIGYEKLNKQKQMVFVELEI